MSTGIFIIESALEQIGAKSPATDTDSFSELA